MPESLPRILFSTILAETDISRNFKLGKVQKIHPSRPLYRSRMVSGFEKIHSMR